MADPITPPGVPSSEPAQLDEPVEPRPPAPPKPSSEGPAPVSATGRVLSDHVDVRTQAGEYLTTAGGVPLRAGTIVACLRHRALSGGVLSRNRRA